MTNSTFKMCATLACSPDNILTCTGIIRNIDNKQKIKMQIWVWLTVYALNSLPGALHQKMDRSPT